MIIYGTGAARLKTTKVSSAVCENCSTKGSLRMVIFSRHFHIFWIPFFPFGKTGWSECQHCKHVVEVGEMSESLKTEYNYAKTGIRPPLWQFSWVGILIVLGGLWLYNTMTEAQKIQAYISDPQRGDIYYYEMEEGYSTMKIVFVDDDSIYLHDNDYAIESKSAISEITGSENYSLEVQGFSRVEILEFFEAGIIYDITRQ